MSAEAECFRFRLDRLVCFLVLASLASSTLANMGCSRAASSLRQRTLVTSVTPLGSIIRNVVGDRFDVLSLTTPREIGLGEIGTPSPSELEALKSDTAGAIFLGTFDMSVAHEMSDTAKSPFPIMTLSHSLRSPVLFPWLDPMTAEAIADQVAGIAATLAPSESGYFQRAVAEFSAAVRRIDTTISATASTVSPDRRKVAATTESMRPFFERYGFTYYSIESEGGASGLAATMQRERIDVVYVNAFGSSTYEELAREVLDKSGARFQGELFDARLPGPVGSLFHTYFGLLIENARQAFSPLGADLSRVDSLRPVDVAP